MSSAYKPENLTDEVRFVNWKIKEGFNLSTSSALLEYETISDSDPKKTVKKLLCNTNCIIVKSLTNLKAGDLIDKNTILFMYDECPHSIVIKQMCANCGLVVIKQQSHVSGLVHNQPGLRVSMEEALSLGRQDLASLIKRKKLVLLVDLDHTLIHTTNEPVRSDAKDVMRYQLASSERRSHIIPVYATKLRPGCAQFLDEMSKYYELHVATFGERNYALKITEMMDPKHKYFHDRILSRNEFFNQSSKTENMKALFPLGDQMVCIIDDREDVWSYARNMICVKPYVYFKNIGDINDPALIGQRNAQRKRKQEEGESSNESGVASTSSTEVSSEPPIDPSLQDPDSYLIRLEQILKQIHNEYYGIYSERLKSKQIDLSQIDEENLDEADLPDMKRVMPLIRSRVLTGCCITFSGVIPTGYDIRKQRCYLMAVALGATVNENIEIAYEDDDSDEMAASDSMAPERKYVYYDENDEDSMSNSSGAGEFRSDSSSRADDKENSRTKNRKNKVYTTHLVAAKFGTGKVHEALKSKKPIRVVTPEWLLDCSYQWTRCDENDYKLTKEYEYKNCVFHQEYQAQQARYANNPSTVNKISSDSTFLTNKVATIISSNVTPVAENEETAVKRTKLSEEMFEMMDKEVNEELSDDEDEEKESNQDDESNESHDDDDEAESDSDADEFALALEQNLINRKQ